MAKKRGSVRNVKTPAFTASFFHLNEKTEQMNGDMAYSISMVFKKGTDLSNIKKAIQSCAVEGWGKDKSSWPKKPKICLKSGNEERDGEGIYKDAMYINATSKQKPGIVDKNRDEIHDPEELYSGIIGRASVNFFTFDRKGSKGIGCSINNFQKFADGPRLDGRKEAADDFADDDIPDEFKSDGEDELDDFFN